MPFDFDLIAQVIGERRACAIRNNNRQQMQQLTEMEKISLQRRDRLAPFELIYDRVKDNLTATEAIVFRMLVASQGTIVSHVEIQKRMNVPTENIVIRHLRTKVKDLGIHISSARDVGYFLKYD